MQGNKLAHLLRALASSIEKLDEAQVDEFVAYLRRFGRADGFAVTKPPMRKKHAKVDPLALDRLLFQLGELPTREAGATLLDQSGLSRKELERMARSQDIHVSKDDNVTKIKEKLVEVVIGSRLSSRAIRGQ